MRKLMIAAAACISMSLPFDANAQGVPTIDTQNITQTIRQLQNMLKDAGIQTEQLDQLI